MAEVIHCANAREALSHINRAFKLDGTFYPAEDTYTGWDKGAGQFHSGAIYGVEGQVLYSLVRALDAECVIEIGTATGCGSTHIAAALQLNDNGLLHTVDIKGYGGTEIPKGIINDRIITYHDTGKWLLSNWEYECQFTGSPPIIDMLFDDGSHARDEVAKHARYARRLLKPGGVYVVHDVAHPSHAANVQDGLNDAGLLDDTLLLLIEPADTGIGVWRKPF